MLVFFTTVKLQRPDQTAQVHVHMHAHADLELCGSDVSWADFTFHLTFLSLFFFFFFFFCKSPDRHIFHLLLSFAKTKIKLCGCSLY